MNRHMRVESGAWTRGTSAGLRILNRTVRCVAAPLLCAGTVACTAILGLNDKPLAEAAADAAAAPPQAILFGGYNQGDGEGDDCYYLNDTWSFDGREWTSLRPHLSPSARSGAATTALAGRMIIFGGTDSNGNDNGDLWSFGAGDWKELDDGSSAAPPQRSFAALAALGANLVLFGGFQGVSTTDAGTPSSLNDTWVWNGTSWAQQKPSTVPPVRDGAAMATLQGKVLVFGGENSTPDTPVNLGDTWEWDGTNWTELHPAHSPSARVFAGIALAPANGHPGLVLFGGADDQGVPLNDNWAWDGTDWTELPAGAPDARAGGAMGSFNGGALLFGGLGGEGDDLKDTWVWNGSTWTGPSVTGPGARVNAALVGL